MPEKEVKPVVLVRFSKILWNFILEIWFFIKADQFLKENNAFEHIVISMNTKWLISVRNHTLRVENGTFLVENGTFGVENGKFRVENGSFLVENDTFLVENGTFRVENDTFWVKNGTFWVEIGTFGVENATFRVENGTWICIKMDKNHNVAWVEEFLIFSKNIKILIIPNFQRYLEQNGQLDFESIWKDEIGRDCIKENVKN